MHHPFRLVAYVMIFFSVAVGGGSLLLLAAFLFIGSFGWIPLGFQNTAALLWDAVLCLIFSFQHSGMIRKSFRKRLAAIIPLHYHDACFSIVSGATLIGLILFWQPSAQTVWHLTDYAYGFTRAAFFLSIAGFLWGGLALGSFDALGIAPVLAFLFDRKQPAIPLVIRGPYRWVRHPLYFFALVMIWSCPYMTADRLLFNLFLTVWIVLGAVMEEKDLVAQFGDTYRRYQNEVPMLIPWRKRGS